MDENEEFRGEGIPTQETDSNQIPVQEETSEYGSTDYRSEHSGYTPPSSPDLPNTKRRGIGAGGIVALALVCSLIGGCLGAGGMLLYNRGANAAEEEPPALTEPAEPSATPEAPATSQPERETAAEPADDGDQILSASQVYTSNVNSTVGITVDITTNYWGYQTTAAASGSGFILSEDGYILTNYHVIEDGSNITVTTFDNQSFTAAVVGYDSGNDIAVLKVEAEGLTPVTLGDSDTLQVGDDVVAIGNPLGELTFSLTHGVVSALDREITLSSGSTMTLIQTDASINSGNSGGPLFNMYGQVIGITNAKYSSSTSSSGASIDNIGFAIPINRVRNIVDSIIQNGYIVKPYIGVSVATLNAVLDIPQGAAVKAVVEGSPAEEAGLQVNDVITQVNGEDIRSSSDLVNAVGKCSPGDTLELTVYRQHETDLLTITLTVGEQRQDAIPQPADPEKEQQMPGGGNGFGYYGFPFGFGNWG